MKSSRTFIRHFLFLIVLFPGLCAASWQGGPAPQRENFRHEFRWVQDGGVSREKAASIVKRRFGGKILSVSETRKQGQVVYRVKGLSDKSQVYVVFVDKKSGRISR
ncbi:PepSY domain-containing protein [Microbulbifer variabilis]|uniref:PepSY domain-containing protein n=1 Tax=Microbulbifer variabilis TaxID=266805 RepID=A0ABY4VEY3_9GAMM|nr:PepSY domain-containing protein [Microbulbifer variabilis]USD22837.1 PepSY domain-containing protein [Microbulbifer variabilis]